MLTVLTLLKLDKTTPFLNSGRFSAHTQKNINTVSGVIAQYISEHLRKVNLVPSPLKLLALPNEHQEEGNRTLLGGLGVLLHHDITLTVLNYTEALFKSMLISLSYPMYAVKKQPGRPFQQIVHI